MTSNAYRALGVSIVSLALLATIGVTGFFGAMVLADPVAPLVLKMALPASATILIVMAIGLGVLVIRELRDERRARERGSKA